MTKRIWNERQDRALTLYQAGLSFSSIAAKIERLDGDGCISTRMAQILVHKGLDRRSSHIPSMGDNHPMKAPRVPDQIFRRAWGQTLGITDWAGWVLAPAEMNFEQAAAWSLQLGSKETIALSSGDTLVRLPNR
jgi:hypothetical protein